MQTVQLEVRSLQYRCEFQERAALESDTFTSQINHCFIRNNFKQSTSRIYCLFPMLDAIPDATVIYFDK